MKEEVFWRNYFFQADQIRRAFLLGIQLMKTPAPGAARVRGVCGVVCEMWCGV